MSEAQTAVIAHADGRFGDALAQRLSLLDQLPPDAPELPGLLGAIAFTYERRRRSDTALEYIERALSADAPVGEPPEAATLRAAEAPTVQIHAAKIYMRAAARYRLAGDKDKAAAYQAYAAYAKFSARNGIRAQRQHPRFHQWGINLAAAGAMDDAVNAYRPTDLRGAMRRATGSVALGSLSESSAFVHHTSRRGFRGLAGQLLVDKPKAVIRGVAAVGVVGLSHSEARPVTALRDWLILAAT